MDYQSFGRQQRPKGANMKQALMVMLLLVVCAWLVYQINHSRNRPDNYGDQPIEQYRAVSLGRKGSPSWSRARDFPNSGKAQFAEAKKTDSGGFDKNPGNVDERLRRSESDHKEQGNNKEYPKVPVNNDSKEAEAEIRGPPNGELLQIRLNTEPDVSIEEIEEVDEPKTVTDEDWAQSFHDENGVPPEVNETEPIDSEVHMNMVHETNRPNNSRESSVRESNIHEVTSVSAENDSAEVTMGGSSRDAEVNSQSTAAHVDI